MLLIIFYGYVVILKAFSGQVNLAYNNTSLHIVIRSQNPPF